ncbi:hypothetical protein GCM10009730_50610 [Streptomyces albidochromogenes]
MRSKQACRPVLTFVTDSVVAAERVLVVLPHPVGQYVVGVVVVVVAAAGTAATPDVAATSATTVAHAALFRPISSPGEVVCRIIKGDTRVGRMVALFRSPTIRNGGAAARPAPPGPPAPASDRRDRLLTPYPDSLAAAEAAKVTQ